MKKLLLLLFLLFMLCLGCNLPEKRHTVGESSDSLGKKYTFEELKTEFKDSFDIWEIPICTWFWDEFGELEAQYRLSGDESKLLGRWMNVTFSTGPYYNYYVFYPNKLFLIDFVSENHRVIDVEEMYYKKAVGIWEIADNSVRITIYAVVTEDRTKDRPNNESVFFVEQPYSFDFIKIDDVDERGFTTRPVNGNVLSAELERKASTKRPNRTNNLYVRNVYYINYMDGGGKDYLYFSIVPELARENLSGLEVATNPELIEKYIFRLWP